MSDVIEKQIDLKAPVARVWRALTDHKEFGEWFRVDLEAPFAVGQIARGRILHPGYEHLTWQATVQTIEPERLFSFTWHPYGIDPKVDYSTEPTTLVEFILEALILESGRGGTRLTLRESGFDAIQAHRRAEAFRMNDQGWTIQMKNIEAHVGR